LGYQYAGVKVNKYLYNDKELIEDNGLQCYDYGQPMYDPSTGRFNRIDRFSEKYYGLSPYHYGANNPIKYIDVNGDSIFVNTQITLPIGTGVTMNFSLYYSNGSFNFQNGNQYKGNDSYVNGVNSALSELENSNSGFDMVGFHASRAENVTIASGDNGYTPGKLEVSWDP